MPIMTVARPGRTTALRSSLMIGTALVSLWGAPAWAGDRCDEALVPQPEGCARSNADIVVDMPVGENAELITTRPEGRFEEVGFSISIDDTHVAGSAPPRDPRRPNDIVAEKASVDIRFDGLNPMARLNVSTADLRAGYRAGDAVIFRSSANYAYFINRAEVRILDRANRRKPVAVLPISSNGQAGWSMPEGGSGDYVYVLRVYDAAGRFDETQPLRLTRLSGDHDRHDTTGPELVAAGEGEDRTAIRNIRISGGEVTAHGTSLPAGAVVEVMGAQVPVDATGRFVTSQILPEGEHRVDVRLLSDGQAEAIRRDIRIPKSEQFYVVLADLTIRRRLRDDLGEAAPGFERTYAEGRLAYYVSAKLASGYKITSSADTGEGDLDGIFQRLNEKDPRNVLLRLDPEDMYPTYGDDSSAYDDTPSQGRVYVRVEKGGSRFTWGDFDAELTGSHFLNQSRALYGAEVRYASPSVNSEGAPKLAATLFAAQPDSLPQRDILRGTGGSVYFLTRQDILGGSLRLSVETVDPDTGRVVRSAPMQEGQDYEVDHMQGVLILTDPLPSSTTDGGLIGGSNEYDVNLVAQYEYTPLAGDLDGASIGARVEAQLTDRLRLGLSGMSEQTGDADQQAAGVDLTYRLGENSQIRAEVVESRGAGFGRSTSATGGLSIDTSGAPSSVNARAYRFEADLDLTDLGAKREGQLYLYAEGKEAGFATLSEEVSEDQQVIGMQLSAELSDRLSFGLDLEQFEKEGGDGHREGELRLSYQLSDTLALDLALGHEDRTVAADASKTGTRTAAAVKLTFQPEEDHSLYVFAQGDLERSGGLAPDNRAGIGFSSQLTEKLAADGEISDGDKGRGAKLNLRYAATADNEVYLGYTLDPTRSGPGSSLSGRDGGTFTLGGSHKKTDTLTVTAENSWDLFGDRRSLTRGYGVTYTPDAKWTFSGAVESGEVRDLVNGDFNRDAYSLGLAYQDGEDQSARLRLEYRVEDGDDATQDAETWALSGGYEYKVNDDWRFLANLDALVSRNEGDSFRDGEYVEAALGYAYRPVMHERLNMLLRYSYLHDLPGVDQVTVTGDTEGPQQKSHIFSVDVDYDLSPKLSLGAKYGYRRSQLRDRSSGDESTSTAHLGILRLDWHVVHKWDAMLEGRVMYTEESDLTETGAVAGLYRHLGNNAKLGFGYEWGEVSDDMADITYEGRGAFVNLIAKF